MAKESLSANASITRAIPFERVVEVVLKDYIALFSCGLPTRITVGSSPTELFTRKGKVTTPNSCLKLLDTQSGDYDVFPSDSGDA